MKVGNSLSPHLSHLFTYGHSLFHTLTAYEVLSDLEKRAIYDQYGYEGLHDGIPNQSGANEGGYSYKQNAQEIFEGFFGTANPFASFGFGEAMPFASKLSRPGPKKPEPIVHSLECSLMELYKGCVKKFEATRKRLNPEGIYVDETKQLIINVKPGWKKGTKVTFPSEGDEMPGTLAADIVFVIQERTDADPGYVRDGHNLIYTYKITLSDALTDCSLQIPTLDGRIISIACPEVVSPFYEKTIPAEGMPLSKKPDSKGDLLIRFHILFPKYLDGTKRTKIKELLANQPLQA